MFGIGPFELLILIGGISVVAGAVGLFVFAPDQRRHGDQSPMRQMISPDEN